LQLAINITLQKSITNLRAQETTQDHSFKNFRVEQSLIERTVKELGLSHVLWFQDTLELESLLHRKSISILFIFSSLDCTNCLGREVLTLNQLSSKDPSVSLQIIGLGFVESLDKTFLRTLTGGIELQFPVYQLLTHRSDHFHTPTILLVDQAGKVILSYISVVGDETRASRFQRVLEMFFAK
jgi:hypothetical protein